MMDDASKYRPQLQSSKRMDAGMEEGKERSKGWMKIWASQVEEVSGVADEKEKIHYQILRVSRNVRHRNG